MSEKIDIELLVNCTILAVNNFQLYTVINVTLLTNLNRSDIIEILNGLIENNKNNNSNDIKTVKNFLTECLFPYPTRPYDLSWDQKTMWSIIFGLMLFIAITGNCIVLWIVTGHRSMRTATNYFLLNLSVADLLMSSLNGIFNFIFMLNSDWPFGSIYCTINNFMANVTVSTSVFTLVAISFDRYIAIVYPLKRRISRRKVRAILTIIWLLSGCLATPCLVYSQTMTKRYSNGKSRTICYMLWPDGGYPTSMADYVYNIIILIFTYGIPMMVMIICYILMARVLWHSRSIGENSDRQLKSIKSKRKVVRMFIAVVSIFAICWLPYHLFFIYAYHNNQMATKRYVQHIFLGFYWLAMSNAMVNPIIYYRMNKRFRLYFQKAICCLCFNAVKVKNISLHSRMMQSTKSTSQRSKKTAHNSNWKRSTIETQIHMDDNETAAICRKELHKNSDLMAQATLNNRMIYEQKCNGKVELKQNTRTEMQTDAAPCLKMRTPNKHQCMEIAHITCDKDQNALSFAAA